MCVRTTQVPTDTVKLCLCHKCSCHRPTHQPACVTGSGSARSVQTRAEDLTDYMVSSAPKMPSPAIHTRFCSALCGASFILISVGSWSDLRTAAQSHHLRLTASHRPKKRSFYPPAVCIARHTVPAPARRTHTSRMKRDASRQRGSL